MPPSTFEDLFSDPLVSNDLLGTYNPFQFSNGWPDIDFAIAPSQLVAENPNPLDDGQLQEPLHNFDPLDVYDIVETAQESQENEGVATTETVADVTTVAASRPTDSPALDSVEIELPPTPVWDTTQTLQVTNHAASEPQMDEPDIEILFESQIRASESANQVQTTNLASTMGSTTIAISQPVVPQRPEVSSFPPIRNMLITEPLPTQISNHAPVNATVLFPGRLNRQLPEGHFPEIDFSAPIEEIIPLINRILPDDTELQYVGMPVVGNRHRTRNEKPHGSRGKPSIVPKPRYKDNDAYDGVDEAQKFRNIARRYFSADEQVDIESKCIHVKKDFAIIERKRYFRSNIQLWVKDHDDYVYLPYEDFRMDDLYSPQYYRVRMEIKKHENGTVTKQPYNNTRHGLCPYCPHLNFLDLKTTAYGQHLAYHHGVYVNGFLTPDALLYGKYSLAKENTERQTHAHERVVSGVVCPVCHKALEVEASKMTREVQPFYNYLRHFKHEHRQSTHQAKEWTFFDRNIPL